MNRNEILCILTTLKVAFPNAYKGIGNNAAEATVSLWERQFKDFDFKEVEMAVDTFISNDVNGFSPTIGQIKEIMYQNSPITVMGEQEAWSYVHKALRNSGYNYAEEFAKLPEIVQKSVVTARQLHEWCLMNSDELQTVGKSHFLRAFRTIAEREKQNAKTPNNVKEFFEIGVNDEQLRID